MDEKQSIWIRIGATVATPIVTALLTSMILTHVMQQVMAEQIRQLKEHLSDLKSEMHRQDELCGRNYDRLNDWIIRHEHEGRSK